MSQGSKEREENTKSEPLEEKPESSKGSESPIEETEAKRSHSKVALDEQQTTTGNKTVSKRSAQDVAVPQANLMAEANSEANKLQVTQPQADAKVETFVLQQEAKPNQAPSKAVEETQATEPKEAALNQEAGHKEARNITSPVDPYSYQRVVYPILSFQSTILPLTIFTF